MILAVGAFRYCVLFYIQKLYCAHREYSLYHFYSLLSNTTTIEGWEKDKAAMLRRHGKIEEVSLLPSKSQASNNSVTQVKFPYASIYFS